MPHAHGLGDTAGVGGDDELVDAGAVTLVSALGRGKLRDGADPSSGYESCAYGLAGGDPIPSTLFGVALRRALVERERLDVRRWLVLGTPTSVWRELLGLLAAPDADDVRAADAIDRRSHGEGAPLTQADLDAWQAHLNRRHGSDLLRLRLHDSGLDRSGHDAVLGHVLGGVLRGSSVVFDLTNGPRHIPMIAALAAVLMRRTHALGRVRIVYASFDYGASGRGRPVPVVEVDLAGELIAAAEALATLAETGNFVPLARQIAQGGRPELLRDAERLWFHEATHQTGHLPPAGVDALRDSALNLGAAPAAGELPRLLCDQLRPALPEVPGGLTPAALARRVEARLRAGDYTNAALVCYEGLVSLAVARVALKWQGPPGNLKTVRYRERMAVERWVIDHRLDKQDKGAWNDVRYLRNAVGHAAPPEGAAAQSALRDAGVFVRTLDAALELAGRLDRVIPQGAQVDVG